MATTRVARTPLMIAVGVALLGMTAGCFPELGGGFVTTVHEFEFSPDHEIAAPVRYLPARLVGSTSNVLVEEPAIHNERDLDRFTFGAPAGTLHLSCPDAELGDFEVRVSTGVGPTATEVLSEACDPATSLEVVWPGGQGEIDVVALAASTHLEYSVLVTFAPLSPGSADASVNAIEGLEVMFALASRDAERAQLTPEKVTQYSELVDAVAYVLKQPVT